MVVIENSREKHLQETFLEDSGTVVNRINKNLLQLEKNPRDIELIHNTFREIHSLKSEASYLRLNDLTQEAHRFETVLGDIRDGKKRINEEILNRLFSQLNNIQEKVKSASNLVTRKITGNNETTPFESAEEQGETTPMEEREMAVPKKGIPLFTDFEKELLQEASERGEKLYRCVCELEEDTSMKFPRVYLLINNLELIVNVVKIVPDIEEVESAGNILEIYYTSSMSDEKVNEALNVDEVKRIQIASLDFDSSIVKTIETETHPETPIDEKGESAYLHVETGKIEDISGYVHELQLRINNLKGPGQESSDLENMRRLAGNLDRVLKTIRLVPLKTEFTRMYRLVRDTANRFQKKVDFFDCGGDIEVDRTVVDLLSEILLHLVRNALDHGIEGPQKRVAQGKPETGTVFVAAHSEDRRLIIQVLDDGQGVAIGKELSSEELLQEITRPGFSTKEEKTDSSGMGVGLDIVNKKITRIEGAALRMITRSGEGTVFTIEMPDNYAVTTLLLARCGDITVGIPKKNIESTTLIDPSLFRKDNKGGLTYQGHPVFTVDGRVCMSDKQSEENFALFLSYMDSSAYLLVDEVLFEKKIQDSQLKIDIEFKPHIHSSYIGNEKVDFFYLNPDLIE